MKHFLFIFHIFFVSMSFSQIALEHIYPNANGVGLPRNEVGVNRVVLEYSGEKYYSIKSETNELEFYNSDHSWWKTIPLTTPIADAPWRPTRIIHVSEAKINPDANLEIVYNYYDESQHGRVRGVSENGTVLLDIPGYCYKISEIVGSSEKLLIYYSGSYMVYSLSGLTLEHIFPTSGFNSPVLLERINLPNSGIKYYVVLNQNLIFYNEDESVWKTINLPKPSNCAYYDLDIISDNDGSNLMKIGYTYVYYTSNANYTGKVVDENSNTLLTIPNASSMEVNSIPDANDKLIVNYTNGYSSEFGNLKFSDVYDLPTLTFAHTFENNVLRVNLENSGEKYCTYMNSTQRALIYNSDYSVWKFIQLTVPTGSIYFRSFLSISETKINSDPSIEVVYNFVVPCGGGTLCFTDSYVVGENGQILLSVPYAYDLKLSEFPGRANKLIATINLPETNEYCYGAVYGMGALGNSVFEKESKITVSPNPASIFLEITSEDTIVQAEIYNTYGAKVFQKNAADIHKINVEQFPAGIYLLTLRDKDNQKSVHKISVVH